MKTGTFPKKILVFDTAAGDQSFISWQFPRDEYSVTVASDIGEAADLVSRRDYDLALLEVEHPKDDSIQLLRKIRREHPMLKVVMFTDFGDEELWVQVINEGASDLIMRPFARVELERQLG